MKILQVLTITVMLACHTSFGAPTGGSTHSGVARVDLTSAVGAGAPSLNSIEESLRGGGGNHGHL